MRRPCLLLFALLAGVWTSEVRAQPEPPPTERRPEPTRRQPGEPGEAEPAPGEQPGEAEAEGEGEAEQAPKPRTVTPEPDEDDPPQPLTTPAPSSLTGHFTASASLLWAIPFASLEDGVDQTEFITSGPGFGLELALGVSRTVAIGGWGQMLMLDGSDDCTACSARSLAGGVFVRYHLVQGMRFDPWMTAGLGYRTTTIDPGNAALDDVTYSGIEWLRLQVGGDWYAFDNVGFGPFMELDMGRYSSRSPGGLEDGANHWHFILGARVTLDVPGK